MNGTVTDVFSQVAKNYMFVSHAIITHGMLPRVH